MVVITSLHRLKYKMQVPSQFRVWIVVINHSKIYRLKFLEFL